MTDTALPSSSATLRTWGGFAALCAGMFMAVLDIQIVVTSLSVIDASLKIGADRISWIQTSYLIAEVIAIPLTGFLDPRLQPALAGDGCRHCLYRRASAGCAAQRFRNAGGVPRAAGTGGRRADSRRVLRRFLLFQPGREQTIATTMAGVIAVMAPALGPICGGLITESLSWHWLFLVNLLPGVAVAWAAAALLPREFAQLKLLRQLDLIGLALLALGLSAFEIALKEAPDSGWLSLPVVSLFLTFAVAGTLVARRANAPVDFSLLRDRNLAFGSAISFILGIGSSAPSICCPSSWPMSVIRGPSRSA